MVIPLKLHEHIDVAALRVEVVSYRRPRQIQPLNAQVLTDLFYLRQMFFDNKYRSASCAVGDA